MLFGLFFGNPHIAALKALADHIQDFSGDLLDLGMLQLKISETRKSKPMQGDVHSDLQI